MSDETRTGEANAGFESFKDAKEVAPRSFDLALSSMRRFEAQKAAEREELADAEHAVITAAKEWGEASAALELADEAVANGGVGAYPELSLLAREAFDREQDKLTALRSAVDALSAHTETVREAFDEGKGEG